MTTELSKNTTYDLKGLSFEDIELIGLSLEYHDVCEPNMVDRQQELIGIIDHINILTKD